MIDHDDDPKTPKVPDYAADGKGSKKDLKKEELQEAIANLLRKHLQG